MFISMEKVYIIFENAINRYTRVVSSYMENDYKN